MGEGAHEGLFEGSPREVLMRLADGDPLELGARTEARIEERAMLVDLQRVLPKVLAQVALRSRNVRRGAELAGYLTRCIDRALGDLSREEREEERLGLLELESVDGREESRSSELGPEPAQSRRGRVRFNDLPLEVRRTYFALCVEERSLEAWALERRRARSFIEEELRRALEALSPAPEAGGSARRDARGGGS